MAKCTKRRRFTLLRQLRRRQAARATIGMESLEPRAMLATLYWDPNGATPGVGGSGTWDLSTANWTTDPSGSSPTIAWTNNAADVAVFNTTPDSSGSVPASTVTIGSGIAVSQATFPSGAYTLQGGSLSVPSGLTIGVDAGSSATWAGAFSGAGSLVKTGSGTLTVSGSNTVLYGGARLEGGTLVVANNAALGTGTIQMAGGSLQASGARTLTNALQAVTGTTSTLVSPSGSNLTLNGSITGSGTIQKTGTYSVYLGGDNSAFAGTFIHQASNLYFNTASAGSALAAWAISGGGQVGMNFSGNAVVQLGSLSGTSGWIHGGYGKTGTKTIEVGALGTSTTYAGRFLDYDAVNGGSQIALRKLGSGTLTLTGGSSPYLGGSRIEAGTIIVGSDTALGSGTIQLAAGALQASGTRTLANAIQAVAGTTSTIVSPSGSNLTLNGSITGSGTIQKTGAYSVYLGGDNSAFAGTFIHQSSNLYFNTPSAGSALAAWAINGGGQLGMNFSGNAVVQLGSLAGTSGVIHGGYGKTGTKTIEVGALNTSTTYAGRFTDYDTTNGGSQIALRKIGAGTLTLSAASTHSGATEVLSGVLNVTGSLAASNVLASNGGAFKGVAAVSELPAGGMAAGLACDLWVTWTPASGRSAYVPYQVVDGGTVVDTVLVNQTQAPVGKVINGTTFQKLGTFVPSGNALSVCILSQPSGTTDSGAVASETSTTPPPHLFYRLEGLSFSVGETSSPITTNSVAPTYAGWMDVGSWKAAVERGIGGTFTIRGRNGAPDQIFTFPDRCSVGYAAEFIHKPGNDLAAPPFGVAPAQKIVVFEDWTDGDFDDDFWLPYVAEGKPTVNVDTDSDNDSVISHAVDDPIEDSTDLPGSIVPVGVQTSENLAEVRINSIGLAAPVPGNVLAALSASNNNIRVYADAAGTQLLFEPGKASRTWDAYNETLPTTVYVAGAESGTASLTWSVSVDGYAISDTVKFTFVAVDLDVTPSEVDEDGFAGLIYTFARSVALPTPLTVDYIVTGGTATEGIDFTGLPPGTGVRSITIPANSLSASVTVFPTRDSEIEHDETAVLVLLPGAGYGLGTKTVATGTILNDDYLVDLILDGLPEETAPEPNELAPVAVLPVGVRMQLAIVVQSPGDFGTLTLMVTFGADVVTFWDAEEAGEQVQPSTWPVTDYPKTLWVEAEQARDRIEFVAMFQTKGKEQVDKAAAVAEVPDWVYAEQRANEESNITFSMIPKVTATTYIVDVDPVSGDPADETIDGEPDREETTRDGESLMAWTRDFAKKAGLGTIGDGNNPRQSTGEFALAKVIIPKIKPAASAAGSTNAKKTDLSGQERQGKPQPILWSVEFGVSIQKIGKVEGEEADWFATTTVPSWKQHDANDPRISRDARKAWGEYVEALGIHEKLHADRWLEYVAAYNVATEKFAKMTFYGEASGKDAKTAKAIAYNAAKTKYDESLGAYNAEVKALDAAYIEWQKDYDHITDHGATQSKWDPPGADVKLDSVVRLSGD